MARASDIVYAQDTVSVGFPAALSAALAHELVALAMAKEKEVSDRILDALLGLIRNPDTRLLPPQWSTFERVLALRELDSRLQPLDAFHIASAIDAKVRVFVTLDPLLLKSEALKRELPVYVLHPRMLLGRQPR